MNQLISTFSENECRKSVINYNGLSITKPIIQNEMTGKHSKPSTPPSWAVKTVEIIARDNTEIIKNDTISNRTTEKIESSISNKNESKIEEPTVNVWKKSWASLFDKDVKTISNEKIDNKINDSHVTSTVDNYFTQLNPFYLMKSGMLWFSPTNISENSSFYHG